jgi:hypothetical protein
LLKIPQSPKLQTLEYGNFVSHLLISTALSGQILYNFLSLPPSDAIFVPQQYQPPQEYMAEKGFLQLRNIVLLSSKSKSLQGSQ